MEIQNSFFYTKIKIKYYNSCDLLKYKSKYNTSPKYNEIKIYLPDWFIEKTKPKSNNSGLVDFRYYIHNFPTITDYFRELATKISLDNKYQYNMSGGEEEVLKEFFSTDLLSYVDNPIVVSKGKVLSEDKLLRFVLYVILDLDEKEFPLDIVKDFLTGENKNVGEQLEEYSAVIKHLQDWLKMLSSDNLKKEINLSVGEKRINFNVKSHFIREYINFINSELYNLECNANYTFINYKDNFDGKIENLDYANKRMTNAFNELENRKKAKTLLYHSIDFKAYLRTQNDNSQIYGGMIVLKGLFNFTDADIYFIYKMRQKETLGY